MSGNEGNLDTTFCLASMFAQLTNGVEQPRSVEEWLSETAAITSQSDDVLLTMFSRGLEATKLALSHDSDTEQISTALVSLDHERARAIQAESQEPNTVRRLSFGLIDSLRQLILKLRETRPPPLFSSVPMNDPTADAQREVKEEPVDDYDPQADHFEDLMNESLAETEPAYFNAVQAFSDIEDEGDPDSDRTAPFFNGTHNSIMDTMRRPARSVIKPVKYRGFFDSEVDDGPSMEDSEPEWRVNAVKRKSAGGRKSVFKKVSRRSDTEMKCHLCHFRTTSAYSWVYHLRHNHSTTASLAGLVLRCECGHESQSQNHSLTCRIANFTVIRAPPGWIPTRKLEQAGRVVKQEELDDYEDNDNDEEEEEEKEEEEEEDVKPVVRRKIMGYKKYGNEIVCPECSHRTRSVSTWIHHLRNVHSTTPGKAGLVLRCECGHESQSQNHSLACDIAKITVYRNRQFVPIKRGCRAKSVVAVKPDPDVTPPRQLVKKMNRAWKVNRASSVVAFKPDPDAKRTARSKIPIDCFECDYSTRSIGSWVHHLRNMHGTTPTLAGIALRCKCGYETRSLGHATKCDVASFTVIRTAPDPIRRLDDKKVKGSYQQTTPKCILCETYPKTVGGYVKHLQVHHQTTLMATGIFLECSCGFSGVTQKAVDAHSKECKGIDYSVHYSDME